MPKVPVTRSRIEETWRMDKLSPETSGREMAFSFGQGTRRSGSPQRAQNAQTDDAICQTGHEARRKRICAEADDWAALGRPRKMARIFVRSRCFSSWIIENTF